MGKLMLPKCLPILEKIVFERLALAQTQNTGLKEKPWAKVEAPRRLVLGMQPFYNSKKLTHLTPTLTNFQVLVLSPMENMRKI